MRVVIISKVNLAGSERGRLSFKFLPLFYLFDLQFPLKKYSGSACKFLIHYRPSRTLRSSDKELLVQPRCHLKTYGEQAFSFIAPKLWNTLPLSIRRCK